MYIHTYVPMITGILKCSQGDEYAQINFCITAGCFQPTAGKRQKRMSQRTEMKGWWNEGNMELESCDLKREQTVQLSE